VKVIFIEDIPKVARVGQTREVADGYARNYLLPRKLAVVADSQAAVAIDSQLKKKIKQRELEEAEMAKLAEKIEGVEITIRAKVGESEKLYGSVTAADVAEELAKSAGHDIDKKKIEIADPIRQLGIHDVTLRFTHDITAVIKVNVMSDEVAEEKPEKAEKKEKKPKAKTKRKAKARAEKSEAASEEPEPEAKLEEPEAKTKRKAKTKAEKPEAASEEPEPEAKLEEPEAKTKRKAKTRAEKPEAASEEPEPEAKLEEPEADVEVSEAVLEEAEAIEEELEAKE